MLIARSLCPRRPMLYATVDVFLSLSLSEAALELFGSSANGFGSYDSDVDLCLILNEEYTVREHTSTNRSA